MTSTENTLDLPFNTLYLFLLSSNDNDENGDEELDEKEEESKEEEEASEDTFDVGKLEWIYIVLMGTNNI